MGENLNKIILEEINRDVWLYPFKYDGDVFSVMKSLRELYNIISRRTEINPSNIVLIKAILDDFDNYHRTKSLLKYKVMHELQEKRDIAKRLIIEIMKPN